MPVRESLFDNRDFARPDPKNPKETQTQKTETEKETKAKSENDNRCKNPHDEQFPEMAEADRKETKLMILSPDFCDHYKTRLLIRLAGHAGVFSLLKLWAQCQFRKSERIDKPPHVVAAIADWDGDPDVLESALKEAGFGHREGDTFIMHQWEQHNVKLTTNWANGKKGGRPKERQNQQTKKPTGMKL